MENKKAISVEELYDYITSQVTPEEALKKLLEGVVSQYNFLRTEKPEEGGHPEFIMALAAMEKKWFFAIPNGNNSRKTQGMIAGTEEFLDELFEYNANKRDQYQIFSPPDNLSVGEDGELKM